MTRTLTIYVYEPLSANGAWNVTTSDALTGSALEDMRRAGQILREIEIEVPVRQQEQTR
jgi:hypothetical protein